jgi:hypothetical protein
VDVDRLISQKKKLLKKLEMKITRLQKTQKPPKKAGPLSEAES